MKYCPVTRTSFFKKFERSLGKSFASRVVKNYKTIFKGALIRRSDIVHQNLSSPALDLSKVKTKKSAVICLCRENFLCVTVLKIY